MEGWIKLHRSITESSVFEDSEVLKLWIWILCNVAYNDHDVVYLGKVIHVKSGQIVTGRKKISQQIRMTENRVYRALKILKDLGNINVDSNNKFSVITIINWSKYQGEIYKLNIGITATQQQTNSKLTANQQQNHSESTTNKQLANTTKEYKEYKEGEEYKEKERFALSGVAGNGIQYSVIDGEKYDSDGSEINEAGLKVIDFGFKDRGF